MGKGSKRRPRDVPQSQFDKNWHETFKQKDSELTTPKDKTNNEQG